MSLKRDGNIVPEVGKLVYQMLNKAKYDLVEK